MESEYHERQPPQPQEPVRPLLLWFAFAGPMLIWALHLFVGYALAALDCYWNILAFDVLGLSGVRFVLFLLTVVALLPVILAGVLGYRRWRGMQQDAGRVAEDATGRVRFMLVSGAMLSGLFALGLLWSFFVIFLVERCP